LTGPRERPYKYPQKNLTEYQEKARIDLRKSTDTYQGTERPDKRPMEEAEWALGKVLPIY
jgi:hypothetical protein